MQPYEERPGTSFTSKRQVQTEQRKRQLNVGTLETEDKSAMDGLRKIRPTTQINYQKLAMNRDRKHKNIPLTMVYDRESLYEEVINAKQINNTMQRENINLQTKVKHLEEELFRALKQASSNETIINQMESYYQEPKSSKNSLVIDLKKQVKKLKDEIKGKDQQIQQLQKSAKLLKVKELEIELLSYQNETQRLKSIISVMQNNEFENLNDGLQDTVQSLRIELTEQQAQNYLQEEQLKNLKIRLRESDSKQTKYLNEKLKKDRLNAHLKEVIESLKFKDPEFKKQNKATESEQLLKIELDSKQSQIDQLITNLKIKDQQYYELDKKMKEFEREQQQLIDQLERERQQLKDQCNSLKEEVSQQSGRRRTVQTSFFEKPLQTLPEDPEITDQKHKKLLPCITKEDVLGIGKILKLKLKVARIPFNQIEHQIFIDDANTIVLEELHDRLQNYPFDLNEDESLKVARYLVEDNDEKLVEFSMEAATQTPRVKRNYSLIEQQEEDQLFQEIGAIFTKYRVSMEDYLLKVKKSQEFCSVDDLEDALKYAEQTLQPSQYEYVLLKNFELTQHVSKIDYKKIFQYFHFEIKQDYKYKSTPNIEINESDLNQINQANSKQKAQKYSDMEPTQNQQQVNNNQSNNLNINNQNVSPKNTTNNAQQFNNKIEDTNNNNDHINQGDESKRQQIEQKQQPSDIYGNQLEQNGKIQNTLQNPNDESDVLNEKRDTERQEQEEGENAYQLDKLDQDHNSNYNSEENQLQNGEENNEEDYQSDIRDSENEKVKSSKNLNYEDEDFDQ